MQDPFRKYQASSTTEKKVPLTPKKKQPKKLPPVSKKKRTAEPFPVTLFCLCVAGMIISALALLYPDEALKSISGLRLRIPLLMAADEENQSTLNTEVPAAPADEQAKTQFLPADELRLTMENTSLNQSLESKRRELEQKERNLARLAEDLELKKAEIDKQLAEMQEMRRAISSTLDERVKADQTSVDKLVDVYATMRPNQAAKIISSLNEELAIKILSKMKKQNAAEILNFIEPAKAQHLSEKYAGLKGK